MVCIGIKCSVTLLIRNITILVAICICLIVLSSFVLSSDIQAGESACSNCNNSCILETQFRSSLSAISLDNLTISPTSGPPGTLFVINAIVTDVLPITEVKVTIFYNTTKTSEFYIYDDGLHYDAEESDSIYGYVLNSSFLNETIYRLDITITNNQNQSRTFQNAGRLVLGSHPIKNENKYAEKEVFILSDHDWKEVLPFVSVAYWNENNGTIRKNPVLIFHEEFLPGKTIQLSKDELLTNTRLPLSWNFKEYNLASGNLTPGQNISIDFTLSQEKYDRMMNAIPRMDLYLQGHTIDPNLPPRKINYTIYLNGIKLDRPYWYFNEPATFKNGVVGIAEVNILQPGTNQLTLLPEYNNNVAFESFDLLIPYFATDTVDDYCTSYDENEYPFELCNVDVFFPNEVSPDEYLFYGMLVKNIGRETVDLSGADYRLQGWWATSFDPIFLYDIPYSDLLSEHSIDIPKVKIAPGETALINYTLKYDKSNYVNEYSFDADAVIDFLQQYQPDHVTIASQTISEFDNILMVSGDLGADLSADQITKIEPSNYLSFWQYFDSIIYSEDDYSTAITASTYAALLNIPLIIEGSSVDLPNVFLGKKVICVGNVHNNALCTEAHSKSDVEQLYVNATRTDKRILLNPSDQTGFYSGIIEPEKSSRYIRELYSKLSFVAPFLAAAKQELILQTENTAYPAIDAFLDSKFALYGQPNYLTIFGFENHIPKREYMYTGSGYAIYRALDASEYADTTGDGYPDMAVGRITGFTTSDVSSLVMKSIFYTDLPKSSQTTFVASSFSYMISQAEKWSLVFQGAGYDMQKETSTLNAPNFSPALWENNLLVSYQDHGSSSWAGISSSSIPKLTNTIIFDDACSTCSSKTTSAFCQKSIRKGAIANLGAVSVAWTGNTIYLNTMNNIFFHNMTLGDAYSDAFVYGRYTYQTMMIGDPTLSINPNPLLNQEITR